ncbi:hypothetical protein ACPYO6_15510 [Georgenia sp. Z1344]|uniref:hypothetical protein n=1 Tax=Georgenia sp. Z1344 TaxID=3416706 RepID=UPI003CF79682
MHDPYGAHPSPGAHTVQGRHAAQAPPLARTTVRRLARRRTIAIGTGALLATAAAAVALPILGEIPDFRGTTFDEVITVAGVLVVALLGYGILLAALPYRRWSGGARNVTEPKNPWLDLLRGLLAIVPAAVVAGAGNGLDDAPLALAGALASATFGYVAALRIPWRLLDHGPDDRRATRRTRVSRALVALLLGLLSLAPILLVPGYGGEQVVLGLILLVGALVVSWVGYLLGHILPGGL